jgi:hypothetical protein
MVSLKRAAIDLDRFASLVSGGPLVPAWAVSG